MTPATRLTLSLAITLAATAAAVAAPATPHPGAGLDRTGVV